MPRIVKRFRFDKKQGKCVEITQHQALETRPKQKSKWPIVSQSMAVNPEDIGRAQSILKKHGVTTQYTPTGEPILRDPTHRKEHGRALGFYDRNCFGGVHDLSPVNK